MIDLKPLGIKDLKANLEEAAKRGKDPRPAFRDMAPDIREGEKQYLGRVRWAPLSPEYAARKVAGKRIGELTGVLLDSTTNPGNRFHVEKITEDSLTVATKHPLAHIFNKGRKGSNAQPARKLWRLTPKTRKGMLSDLTDYLLDPLR